MTGRPLRLGIDQEDVEGPDDGRRGHRLRTPAIGSQTGHIVRRDDTPSDQAAPITLAPARSDDRGSRLALICRRESTPAQSRSLRRKTEPRRRAKASCADADQPRRSLCHPDGRRGAGHRQTCSMATARPARARPSRLGWRGVSQRHTYAGRLALIEIGETQGAGAASVCFSPAASAARIAVCGATAGSAAPRGRHLEASRPRQRACPATVHRSGQGQSVDSRRSG